MKRFNGHEFIFRVENILPIFSLSVSVVLTLLLMTLINVKEGGLGIVYMWAGTAGILFIEGFLRSRYSSPDYPSNAFSQSGMLPMALIYLASIAAFLGGFLFILQKALF